MDGGTDASRGRNIPCWQLPRSEIPSRPASAEERGRKLRRLPRFGPLKRVLAIQVAGIRKLATW